MKFLRRSLMGLFLTALTLGLLGVAGSVVRDAFTARLSDTAAPSRAKERVYTVSLTRAVAQEVDPVLETFGEIYARRTLELRPATAGRILALSENFEDGGRVRAGDVLIRIDPTSAQADVDRLSADLADAHAEERDALRGLGLAKDEIAAAEAQARLRQNAFERQIDLADRGVGSAAAVETAELAEAAARAVVLARRQAVTQAEARIDQAATRIARSEIALQEAKRQLADTIVTAPFDGILSAPDVVEGGLVSVNERLADLIDPTDLEVAFRVSTAQYVRLLGEDGLIINAPVRIFLDVTGVDLRASGRLSRVSAGGSETTQTGRLIFARLDRAAGFRPGDFVSVEVIEPPLKNIVRLPATALNSAGEVLVMSQQERLEVLPVDLVRRQGNDVLVRGVGLVGRDVVRVRTPLLGPGIAVKPQSSTTDAQEQSAATPDMLELSDEHRARLVAFVQDNNRMPEDAKARVLAQLAEREVPAQIVARLESRMGG